MPRIPPRALAWSLVVAAAAALTALALPRATAAAAATPEADATAWLEIALIAAGIAERAAAAALAFAVAARETLLAIELAPLADSPGLWLVLGGGVTLTLLVPLMALRTSVTNEPLPAGAVDGRTMAPLRATDVSARAHDGPAYRGPRDTEYERGRLAGSRAPVASLDEVLDYVIEAEMGQPRVVRSMPRLMRVRLHDCRGCRLDLGLGAAGVAHGCAFECGFLETSLERGLGGTVLVHETTCRARGADACDFEVWY